MTRIMPALPNQANIQPLMWAKPQLLACLLLAALALAAAPAMAASITINGTASGSVYGNSTNVDGSNSSADPNNNTLYLLNGATVGWDAYGAHSNSADVSGNQVIVLDGATVNNRVFGGQTTSAGNAARNNSVHISGGIVKGVNIYGGYATAGGDTDGNNVHISGGTISSTGTMICGGWSSGGNSSGNLVRISGGDYNGASVYGGRSNVNATDNRVIIESAVTGLQNLYGGWAPLVQTSNNNTLDLNAPGLSISGDMRHFQYLNFYLPDGWAAGDPLLRVGAWARIDGATVSLIMAGDASPLAVGDQITLISTGSGFENPNPTAQGIQGSSLLYDLNIYIDTNNLYAQVLGVSANPGLKAMMEAQVGGLAFLGQAADLVAGPGMYDALAKAKGARSKRFAFGTLSGGLSRYKSGSHVDVEGASMLAGLGWSFALNRGKRGTLLVAPFIEAGLGSYDSHNSFRNYASVDADGDIHYYGLGVLTRYSSPIGLYIDGSARCGQVETDFNSKDIRNPMNGEKANYETEALYYGAHLGVGYLWNISRPLTLDIYSKFLWTHQNGDKVNMTDERYKFDGINSLRSRSGARLDFKMTRKSGAIFAPYAGAAFDYEFDSKAHGKVHGRDIDSADIKGETGMGELGLAYKSPRGRLSLNLGLQGYTGKRAGASGSLQAKWEF